MILAVLKRDAELKKLEEQRIKQLRKNERDRSRLKYLTGEWFYETKNHRHRDRIHGSDIIRESMRQKKPVTLLELTQRWSEKPSIYGEKKDVYIPPELLGLIEEPSTESHNERVDDELPEGQRERQRPQIKPRQNPFNNLRLQRDEARLINGVKEADKTPAEGHHEVYGEPQSSQVSNFHGSTELTGKATGLSAEGQTDKVTVEEGRSFSKVLEWFGRGSRDGKLKESPVNKEMNEEEPKDHESPEAKSEDSVPQPKTKPPPKSRRGLFALFSRADISPEVQTCEKEEISQDKTENSEYKTSYTLRREDENILRTNSETAEILRENETNKPICEDPLQRETFDQDEISPGRLASLKSFWERGNKGPKILSIKKEAEVEESEASQILSIKKEANVEESETSQLNENDHNAVDRRLSDSSISPSKPKPDDPNPTDVESTTCDISLVSPRRTSSGVEISAISSHEDEKPSCLESNKVSEVSSSELQTLTVEMNSKLSPGSLLKHEDSSLGNELQEESISMDISDLKKEISTFKMSLGQQEDKVLINDLKSFWEKEKSGLRVIVGSPACTANVKDPSPESSPKCSSVGLSEPQFDFRSNSPSSPERMTFKEAGLTQKEKIEQTEEKQSPNTVPLQDLQDVKGDSEDDSPVKAALERANARPISISKSLEDLASSPSLTSNTKTSFSDPEQVKMMSLSVPAFMQQEVTGSVMSIYSSEFGNVEVKGTIQFAIHYVQKLAEFHIFVAQCKDLAVADVKRNRSDPYVKCYLLPDKAKYGKKKTCVRKKTLDPTYNEILRFKIPMETLKTQKLNTSVWHNDTFGRNMFLGEVELDLAEWDFSNTQMNEYLLKGRIQVPTSPKHSVCSEGMSAEIKVALRFVPQTSHSHKSKGNGEVQIWVKECKNLPITRGVAIDPFVKCAVLPDTSRKSRQKTRVLKRASDPVFNHTMVYDGFRQEDLKEACVELTVWDHDRLNNHFIGGIRLGPGTGKSYGTEIPQHPETAMITRKRGRSSLNADVTSTSHEIDAVSQTSNTSETNIHTSPESDTNDWGLDDLLGSGFNWDLDNDVLDAFANFESQTTTSDETDQSAVLDAPASRSRGALQRSKLQDVSGRIINKNAIAARMNRLKKKEYVSGLEERVGSLTTENRVLKQENGNLNKRVEELENETRYLRAVLANESMLAQLLSRLSGVNGMKFSTSLFQESNENDHDYAMPRKRVKVEDKDTAGGICLHVDKDHVSVEFCTKCAESSSLSHKM
ncbi:synaptotagmin 2 isoform X1 [Labeo rohita]|uniref:Synaptotagmin 2 isoform X1 n=1 Tax=Labeo rohita TaxID=84645 RepID=A0A498LUC1_LABRO|nr:synaptotagmin 2 isoform X1 [Labeo rohita]